MVVVGCGPIGIGIIGLCKYLSAEVVAIDVNEHRLNVVKEQFEADHIINATKNPVEKVAEVTEGKLAQQVFDASGNKRAIEMGHEYMRHGGNYVLVGLYKEELSFLHPKIHAKETTLMCSRNATLEDFEFVMKVLGEKKFNTASYITNQVPFEKILTDMDSWASADSLNIKVISSL
ncbi:MAG: zinc-binding dehydrogenase [Bacteroidota bacterium]